MAYGILDTIAPNPWDYGQWGDVSNKSSSVQDYYTKYLGNGGYQAQESAFRIPQPGVPRYGTLPEAPAVPGAAPQMAQIPNILAQQGGGGDGAYNLGGQPGATSAGSLSDMYGKITGGLSDLMGGTSAPASPGSPFGGLGSFTGTPAEQAQAMDLAAKGLGLGGTFVASALTPFGMAAGEAARQMSNNVYSPYGNISLLEDLKEPDLFYGSPEDILSNLKSGQDVAIAGGVLGAGDKQALADFMNTKGLTNEKGDNITPADITSYGTIKGSEQSNMLAAQDDALIGATTGNRSMSPEQAQATQMQSLMDALASIGVIGQQSLDPHAKANLMNELQQMSPQQRDASAQQAIADQLAAEQAAALAASHSYSVSGGGGTGWGGWGGSVDANPYSSGGGIGGSANDGGYGGSAANAGSDSTSGYAG